MTQVEKQQEEFKKPIKVRYVIEETEEDRQYEKESAAITREKFANAKTTVSLQNIQETLTKSIRNKYKKTNGELKSIVKKFLADAHGLNEERFDKVAAFSNFIGKKVNDVSVDANTNKSDKDRTVRSMMEELSLPDRKVIGYDFLYRVLVELEGKEEAKFLTGEMYDLSLALSDSTNILLPYCWAADMSRLVWEGRPWGQLKSGPTKHMESYLSVCGEQVLELSNHLAGAVAVATFFTDLCHVLVYYDRISLSKLKEDKALRKRIEQRMQEFVHKVNGLFRNGGCESPFSNISIFDKAKLRVFLDEYKNFFPKKVKVTTDNKMGKATKKTTVDEDGDKCEIISYALGNSEEDKKVWQEFIIDYIWELQKIFIDFFDRGDPLQGGTNYRFPVVTTNFTKQVDENGKITVNRDNELLQYIKYKTATRYNFFNSKGTKIASCCRMISNKEMQDLAADVNSFGGGNISLGSHRVVTIDFARIAYETKSYDEYLELLRQRVDSAAKILRAHKVLLKKITDFGLHKFISNGWINMSKMFSTFGVMGIVEAEHLLKCKYGNQDFDVMGDILTKFNTYCKDSADKYGFIMNIEQIPGETMAVKMAQMNELLFGNEYGLDPMYSNQFVPLWKNATIFERIEADGRYNQKLSGGGIVHIQVDCMPTPTQIENLIIAAAEAGCEHFAINPVDTLCENEDCGTRTVGNHKTCPKCGSENVSHYTRVVGFYTRVEDWNPVRRNWEFDKRDYVDLKKVEKNK